jgi:hypothetical protein
MALATLTDYKNRMNAAELALRQATKTLSEARDELAKAQDEHRYFTQQERDTRIAIALPKVIDAERDASEAVDEILALTRDVTAVTANPVPSLSPADEATAASRAVFVKEDVASLSLEDLTARVRQAALNGDRVSLFLYARYGKTRLKSQAESAGNHDAGDVAFPRSENGDARTELANVLADVEASFRSRELNALNARAVHLRSDAFELDNTVRARARQSEKYAFQTAHEVSW